jgi:hypothetical protein
MARLGIYHSRFIPEVTETSQIFLQNIHRLPKLALRNIANVSGVSPLSSDRSPSQV